MSMAVFTPSRPNARSTTAVTRSPTPKATAHTPALTAAGTDRPVRRGATHPSGGPATEPALVPRVPAGAAVLPPAAVLAPAIPADPDAAAPAAPAHCPAAPAAGQLGAGEASAPPASGRLGADEAPRSTSGPAVDTIWVGSSPPREPPREPPHRARRAARRAARASRVPAPGDPSPTGPGEGAGRRDDGRPVQPS